MKRPLFYFIALSIICLAAARPIQAQTTAFTPDEIPQITIELWPDYDRPQLLVLVTATLAADVPTPVEFQLPVPDNATLNAAAYFADNQLFDIPAEDIDQRGGEIWILSPTPGIRLEYYVPYEVQGSARIIDFAWTGPVDIGVLNLSLQEPAFAEGFTLRQAVEAVVVTNEGVRFHQLPPRSLSAGESVVINATYDLIGEQLTVGGSAAATAVDPAPSIWRNLQANWPWTAAGLVFLLVALFFGWQTWRGRQPARRPAKPARQRARVCPNCQTPNARESNFCRNCGKQL